MTNDQKEKMAIMTLLRLDASDLMIRIRDRKETYISEFSLKRTRDHFKDIFYTRYFSLSINDLNFLSEDLIITLHDFYLKVEEMRWYLDHTQDMVAQLTEFIDNKIRSIQKSYDKLKLHFDAEFNG